MASYTLRGLDPATIAAARDRARSDGRSLADVLRAYLITYSGRNRGTAGGQARAASLTPAQRIDAARTAALARWRRD